MNIDEQQEDHRRRKAEREEAERQAREMAQYSSTTATQRREELIRRRDADVPPVRRVECKVCRERGQHPMGLHAADKVCPVCFERHRTALVNTGYPDMSEPEIVPNHFEVEIKRHGV